MKHTPGLLWVLSHKTTGGVPKIMSHSGPIANIHWTGDPEVANATAFRLVDCYNACEGINDPQAEIAQFCKNNIDFTEVIRSALSFFILDGGKTKSTIIDELKNALTKTPQTT